MIRAGTDIASVERIRISLKRPTFIDHVYSKDEQKLLEAKRDPAPSAAANWAAKEAFAKALGTGVRGFEMNEIAVLRDELGAPYITLFGKAKQKADELGIKEISVSLSHENDYAIAFVICQG